MNNAAEEFREWVKRVHGTQWAAASSLGVSQGQISRWASGEQIPGHEHRLNILSVTGIDFYAVPDSAFQSRASNHQSAA